MMKPVVIIAIAVGCSVAAVLRVLVSIEFIQGYLISQELTKIASVTEEKQRMWNLYNGRVKDCAEQFNPVHVKLDCLNTLIGTMEREYGRLSVEYGENYFTDEDAFQMAKSMRSTYDLYD